MNDVRIGIIGLRRGAGLARHFLGIKGCRVAALCDKREHLVAKACGELGIDPVKRYTDHRRMLDDKELDAVFVVVATEVNANLVCECLEAGKHTMCEVPLAYTLEDCWRIVLTVERTGRIFQMAEQTRYWPFVTAWKKMVAEGRLGKILYVEGQYFHGFPKRCFGWYDPDTLAYLTEEQARKHPQAVPSRLRNIEHPIWYIPHELSPLLHILDDRVKRVVCMATRRSSYCHEGVPISDMEVALMHTEKDTVMRIAAAFNPPSISVKNIGEHWYHVKGAKGHVETQRSNTDKMKLWLPEENMVDPAEIMWEYPKDALPPAALSAAHWGADYFPPATFIESIRNNTPSPMNVYKAADTAAPGILAAQSAEQGSVCLPVPDFRPGSHRPLGQALAE